MPYILTNSDGSLTVTVADSVVDTSTYSLALVGRNVSNYGQYFAQNTIRQLENFASVTAPSPGTRLVGQLWYDKNEEVLRVWDGAVWKRATNIVIDSANNRPTTSLTGGGTAFFNTTTNKLEVHNGTAFREASYAGEVTSGYSGSSVDNNPTFYGTRIHNIFLKDTAGISNPVLAISYVKSTAAGSSDTSLPNRGTTLINGQYETIMALFSDREFTIDSGQSAFVDGVEVTNLAAELTGTGGIASARSGRSAGVILAGMNIRAEFETTGVTSVSNLYADNIGSSIDPVGNIVVDALTVNSEMTVGNASVTFRGDLDIWNDVTVGGDITAATGVITCANLVVSANTTLNGVTNINGEINVNGVNTQTLGSTGNVIEDAYFGNITTATAVVSGLTSLNGDVDLGNATADLISFVGRVDTSVVPATSAANDLGSSTLRWNNVYATTIVGDLTGTATNATTAATATTITLVATDSTNSTHYPVFVDSATGNENPRTDTGFTYNPSTNTLSASIFSGVATTARYADLAEIYSTDSAYAPGTVVKLGGEAEITETTSEMDTDVFGVISTDPAYLMNSGADGLPVAMTGRVPVKVTGPVAKGERLVSSGIPGVACALGSKPYDARAIIGRSLENKTDADTGLIEAVIGVK